MYDVGKIAEDFGFNADMIRAFLIGAFLISFGDAAINGRELLLVSSLCYF